MKKRFKIIYTFQTFAFIRWALNTFANRPCRAESETIGTCPADPGFTIPISTINFRGKTMPQ